MYLMERWALNAVGRRIKITRMKRNILAIICLFFLGLGLSGCSADTDEEIMEIVRGEAPQKEDGLLRIGLIQTGKESDWRDANTNDYLNRFVEERGYDLIYIDGNSSPERQVQAMHDLIWQRVDYIILQPIVETGWDEAIQEARQAGVPVIVADRQIAVEESEYVAWIGSDFYGEGLKAIEWLEEYLGERNRLDEEINIVLLEGTEGATAAIGRTEGIMEMVSHHDNWNIIASECANFTQGEGQTVMEGLLEKFDASDIHVIISENDNMIFGAMKAMDRKGISYGPEGDIIMISFDALREAFEKMIDGKLHVTVECNPLLAGGVEEIILDLEQGNSMEEKRHFVEEKVYDYQNASEYINERAY